MFSISVGYIFETIDVILLITIDSPTVNVYTTVISKPYYLILKYHCILFIFICIINPTSKMVHVYMVNKNG